MRIRAGLPVVASLVVTLGGTLSACSSPWDYVAPWDGGDFGDDAGQGLGSGSSSGSSELSNSGLPIGMAGSSSGGESSSSGATGIGGSSSSSSGSSVVGFGGSSSSSSGSSVIGVGVSSSSSSGSSSGGGSSSGMRGGMGSSGSSSGGSSSGGMMATSCPPASGTAPTWSSIWSADGFSTSCHTCHGSASSASAAYTWLKGQGYISGTSSTIATQGGSPFKILGGNMPPGGAGISAAAKCALVEWVAAGATNN